MDNIFKIKKFKKKIKNHIVTHDSYGSSSVNYLNDIFKKDQIDHKL